MTLDFEKLTTAQGRQFGSGHKSIFGKNIGTAPSNLENSRADLQRDDQYQSPPLNVRSVEYVDPNTHEPLSPAALGKVTPQDMQNSDTTDDGKWSVDMREVRLAQLKEQKRRLAKNYQTSSSPIISKTILKNGNLMIQCPDGTCVAANRKMAITGGNHQFDGVTGQIIMPPLVPGSDCNLFSNQFGGVVVGPRRK